MFYDKMVREKQDEFQDFGLFCWFSVILNCTVVTLYTIIASKIKVKFFELVGLAV